ncbi:MAG: hypothetical protein V3T62_09000 [Alphaproteobacteria bacterium]
MTEDIRYHSKEDFDWYWEITGSLTSIPRNRWIEKLPEQTDECLALALLERSQQFDTFPISQLPDGPSQKQIDLLTLILLMRAFGPKTHPPAAVMKLVIHRLLGRHGIDETAVKSMMSKSKSSYLALITALDPKPIPDRALTAWKVEHRHILYSGKQASVNHVAKAAGVSRDTIRRWRADHPWYQSVIEMAKNTRLGWEQRQLAKHRG